MEWLEQGGVHTTALALGVLSTALFLLLVGFWSRRPRSTDAPVAKLESEDLQSTLLRLRSELGQFVQDMSGRLDAKVQSVEEKLGRTLKKI